MKEFQQYVGKAVNNHIKENRYTPFGVAKKSGVSRQTVYNVMEGRVTSFNTVKKICDATDVPLWQIVKSAEDMQDLDNG